MASSCHLPGRNRGRFGRGDDSQRPDSYQRRLPVRSDFFHHAVPQCFGGNLAALSFIGIYLWLNSANRGQDGPNTEKPDGEELIPGFYAVGNYILLLIYIGTGSRGGLIVYPGVLLIYFIYG